MKKFSKILAALLAALSVTALAGCSARKAVTAEEFQTAAESAGFTVTDTSSSNYSSSAKQTLSAAKDGVDVQVTYYSFADADSALSWYNSEKNSLPVTGKTVVDSDAYNKYSLTNGEVYYLVVRMNATALLCKATTAKQADADSLVAALKY
jgi:thiamine biosynthesis lipoprotein ApbE